MAQLVRLRRMGDSAAKWALLARLRRPRRRGTTAYWRALMCTVGTVCCKAPNAAVAPPTKKLHSSSSETSAPRRRLCHVGGHYGTAQARHSDAAAVAPARGAHGLAWLPRQPCACGAAPSLLPLSPNATTRPLSHMHPRPALDLPSMPPVPRHAQHGLHAHAFACARHAALDRAVLPCSSPAREAPARIRSPAYASSGGPSRP